MQSADLLAIANAATAPPSAPAAPQSSDDSEAFARALADEMGAAAAARTEAGADGRCGSSGAASEPGRDVAQPERPGRPSRHDRTWLATLGAGRAGQPLGGLLGLKANFETISAGAGAGPKPDPAAGAPFREALDALKAAIDAALQDPANAGAPAGQLPAPVQAALDQVLATAPEGLKGRVEAFAGKLTERLAALLGGQGKPSAEGAGATAGDVAQSQPNEGVLGSVLAALDELKAPPAMPALQKPAADGASPATPPQQAPAAPADGGAARATEAGSAMSAPQSPLTDGPADAAPIGPASAQPGTALGEGVEAAPAHAAPAAAAPADPAAAVRGSPETVALLASAIARKLEGRTTHFDMELHPAEFGRVDVRLRIDADGRVAAQMSFDNPVAAADLRARADELRRQLEQAGFQVASEDLSFNDRSAGGSGQDARQSFAALAEARDGARSRAFAEADRTARLADDASRLNRRMIAGLDVRV